ncbi:Predicted glutamine amidotransferase [Pseudomonas syringae pv. actinidiae]|uniref:Predicted glutamine amidotransferase n=1 Tax=Pseudomonas syringae pv. actinidiae TaxID=103796 RepID=A0AAN4TIR9_PSESF|nr:Predicted glutamine amidotransferase [Pseudomonas syringae pv. actinidiae]
MTAKSFALNSHCVIASLRHCVIASNVEICVRTDLSEGKIKSA